MKYRRLTLDELSELEEDFIQFLAANGIPGPEWENLKANEPKKAGELIDLFSDIIFDKTLENVEYLEFKTPQDIKTFHCQKHKIIMNGLMVDGKSDIDFTQAQDPEEISRLLASSGAKLKVYTAQKKYHPSRKAELFKMMEGGALISRDGGLFKTLDSLKG